MRFDYSLFAIVLHNSSVISSYFSVAPGMTCTCVTVSLGLFVFVYDAAEHQKGCEGSSRQECYKELPPSTQIMVED